MAKSIKNKAGLHKNISSILDGVPIPQGVRTCRPPNQFEPDWSGDSSSVSKSKISSVFKGVPAAPGDSAGPHAGMHPQNNCAGVSPVETPHDRQTSQDNLANQLDCPEESSATDRRTEQSEFVNEVVHYRDPTMEAARWTLGQWIQDHFFAPWEWLRHLLRRSSSKKR